MRSQPILKWTPAVLLVLVLSAACSGAPPAPASPTGPSATAQNSASPPPTALECETHSYACSFAEVPENVRDETERLVAEVVSQKASGATNDELVDWLDAQESVAEVAADEFAVRFRPVGGRGIWLTSSDQVSHSAVLPPATESSTAAIAAAGSWDVGARQVTPNQSVTGPGLSQRRAVVLSPYLWDFGDTDDGEAVADRLRGMPEYASGVTYTANSDVSDGDVSVDDFQGWQGLQVVHVVSHGARICIQGACRAVIAAHAIATGLDEVFASTVRGVEIEVEVVVSPAPPPPIFHVLLAADYFRSEYPGGLNDAVVFLNGCATFGAGASDLAEAIRGTSSVVLGWSHPVVSDDAQAASAALYANLVDAGQTVGHSLRDMGDLVTSDAQTSAGLPVQSTLSSTGRSGGGDLRIRDVVSLQSDATTELGDGAEVAIVGEADDGVPDAVNWQVAVDGLDASEVSALVLVTIDGHAAPPAAVSSGTPVGKSWLLSGTLDMGVDVSVPHPAQFDVSLALPEGGNSVDTVATVLVGESQATPAPPPTGTVWTGHVTHRTEVKPGVWFEAEADLIFTLDPSTAQYRYLVYDVTGGTMTFSVSGTEPDGGCTSTLAPVEVPVTSDNSSGGFRIDTESTPPLFDGSVSIDGPEVEVMQSNCSAEFAYLNGPYGTRASGIFIQVFSSEEPAVEVVDNRVAGASLYGDRTFDLARSE